VAGRERLWRLGALTIFTLLVVVSAGALEEIDTGHIPGSVILALAVVGLPVALVLLSRRGVSRTVLAAGAAVLLVAVAAGGRFVQSDYLDQRYSSSAPDYPKAGEQPALELGQGLGAAYDWARGTHDQSVALSGTMGALFQYGLWGEDGSNDVHYIGQRGDRGSFHGISECPEWIGAINHGDYDYVITTPDYHQDNPAADTLPVERSWIAAAGSVSRVAGAGLVDVWQLTGPLDPAACGKVPEPTAPATG
jgi:hypothetical protein